MVSETVFEELLLFLYDEFSIVSLKQILEDPDETGNNRPCVALTFDDGWADNYSVAYPLLLRYEVPATIFLCTGLMGENHMLPEERFSRIWRHCLSKDQISVLLNDIRNWGLPNHLPADRWLWAKQIKTLPLETKILMLEHLEYAYEVPKDAIRRFLTWDEARLMAQNGICFGSHTVNHSTLPTENDAAMIHELESSHRAIRENLGTQPDFIAYPNGAYDSRVVQIAQQTGFSHGFTTDRGLFGPSTPRHAIPRINMDDSVVVGRSSKLHPSRVRLHLQPLSKSISTLQA
jgi:peptidoglycan/xylan/chitin deacetylase (PgdA/CDA1 family)